MQNVLSYVKLRRDIPFKYAPFNEVDALALAAVAHLDFTGLFKEKASLEEAIQLYKENEKVRNLDEHHKAEYMELLTLMAGSPRYKKIKMYNPVVDINKEETKTFYGLTYYLSGHRAIVMFRGTDSSLLSWKENFTFAYKNDAEGMIEALKYAGEVFKKPFMKGIIMGHSKGGGLAVFASASFEAKLRKKIKKVLVFDGPGFAGDLAETEGYRDIEDRIEAFVPVECVVGNMFRPSYKRKIVAAFGDQLEQHEVINWSCSARGFELAGDTSESSKELSERINLWIESVPVEKREGVINELFNIFSDNNIEYVSDFERMDITKFVGIAVRLPGLSKPLKELLGIILEHRKRLKNIEKDLRTKKKEKN
ncbi:MAG: DUF2974 domain-containing protein [Lachnospiraceae bacterium]|nr:DUF2974 domain-containing protein [Lachnospiraceae bacterium]